ncbi:MAG: hypothetical protein ACE5IY_14805 [bacterium]
MSDSIANDSKLPAAVSPGKAALVVGGAGLLLSLAGGLVDSKQFFYSYLTAFVFWTTIGLGGLFFVMLHHLTGATWSVVLRRIAEVLMITLPLMALFFIPIFLGRYELFPWTHAEAVAGDHLLHKKAPYLNTTFFVMRAAIYFGIWTILAFNLYNNSLRQDENGTPPVLRKMRSTSAPGMVLFAFTLTFASFDWLMSLEPNWYSTIFGVYVFSGTLLSVLAFLLLAALYLRNRGVLKQSITTEHYHDLGKLLFAFTVFWAYIAFCQYFLIWYGNIPEETTFYLQRWQGSWKAVSLLIVFGHFALPFLVLITRAAKRNLVVLRVMGLWLLFMHWVDVHWLVLPRLHERGVSFSWMDLTTMLGIGGPLLWFFWKNLAANALVPVRDPNLKASLQFIND